MDALATSGGEQGFLPPPPGLELPNAAQGAAAVCHPTEGVNEEMLSRPGEEPPSAAQGAALQFPKEGVNEEVLWRLLQVAADDADMLRRQQLAKDEKIFKLETQVYEQSCELEKALAQAASAQRELESLKAGMHNLLGLLPTVGARPPGLIEEKPKSPVEKPEKPKKPLPEKKEGFNDCPLHKVFAEHDKFRFFRVDCHHVESKEGCKWKSWCQFDHPKEHPELLRKLAEDTPKLEMFLKHQLALKALLENPPELRFLLKHPASAQKIRVHVEKEAERWEWRSLQEKKLGDKRSQASDGPEESTHSDHDGT